MCIRIVSDIDQKEFDPTQPLEMQVYNATEIFVSYDPDDKKIPTFVDQLDTMVKSGISFKADIKVDSKNNLHGIILERHLEHLKEQLEINEVIKGISNIHATADQKLGELYNMCNGKVNE